MCAYDVTYIVLDSIVIFVMKLATQSIHGHYLYSASGLLTSMGSASTSHLINQCFPWKHCESSTSALLFVKIIIIASPTYWLTQQMLSAVLINLRVPDTFCKVATVDTSQCSR